MTTQYDLAIKAAAEQFLPGYDWRLFKAQLQAESNLNPKAVSPVGARGIAQFMPKTWEEWSAKTGYKGASANDPYAAIPVAAQYMAYLIKQWSSPRPDIDRYCLALASYNAGLGNILEAQRKRSGALLYAEIMKGLPEVTGQHSKETITYVKRILGYWADSITG